MSHVEVEKQGWFSRIKESFGGIFVGLLMVIVAFPLLFWNEGRAVKRAQDLEFGAGSVLTVTGMLPANDGKLVHITGPAIPEGELTDKEFGVSAPAIKLVRNVEMFQWKENVKTSKDKNMGGSETTKKEYTYETAWSSTVVDSSKFKQANAHTNPKSMPYPSETLTSSVVKLKDYVLAQSIIEKVPADQPLLLQNAKLPENSKLHEGYIYIGKDPNMPDVGDVRIKFSVAPAGELSVVGGQKGDVLDVYTHEKLNNPIVLLEKGAKTAPEMFEAAEQANVVMTWVLRLVGFLLMFFGFKLVTRPISVLADVIPALGSAVGCASGFVSFFVAGAFSLITIAIGWIFYRPLIGILLFVVGAALIGGAVFFFMKQKKAAAAA